MKRINLVLILLLGVALAGATTVDAKRGTSSWDKGVAAFKAGDLDQAAREFQQVALSQPDWPGGHYMLGEVYLRQGNAQKAVAALRKACELDPRNASYQLALGTAYLKSGNYSDAVRMLEKISPASVPQEQQAAFLHMLAVALDKTGDTAAALDFFQKALKANPNDPTLLYNYGSAAFEADDTPTAVAALEKTISLNPSEDLLASARSLLDLIQKPIDEAEYAPYAGGGTSSVVGQAFLRTRGGDVKTGAGRQVTLEPASEYALSWVGHFPSVPRQPVIGLYRRHAIADAEGRFRFDKLPAGKWLVSTEIKWLVPGAGETGGFVFGVVEVKEGETADLVLTR